MTIWIFSAVLLGKLIKPADCILHYDQLNSTSTANVTSRCSPAQQESSQHQRFPVSTSSIPPAEKYTSRNHRCSLTYCSSEGSEWVYVAVHWFKGYDFLSVPLTLDVFSFLLRCRGLSYVMFELICCSRRFCCYLSCTGIQNLCLPWRLKTFSICYYARLLLTRLLTIGKGTRHTGREEQKRTKKIQRVSQEKKQDLGGVWILGNFKVLQQYDVKIFFK